MSSTLPFQPVIILGAARSGTNLLRDLLSSFNGIETWPCDEIPAIWRHGNVNWPNDEFPEALARSDVHKFIRQAFIKQWRHSGHPPVLVEKTCANTLRVLFVAKIFPEAKFVHIIRNGLDVVTSAERRWRGEFELSLLQYYLAKMRFVPLLDLPAYLVRFFENRISKAVGANLGYRFWGPVSVGNLNPKISLQVRCALQWASCVTCCADSLEKLDEARVHTLTYENLVRHPVDELSQLGRFLDVDITARDIDQAKQKIRKPKLGVRQDVPNELILPLQRFGYL